MVDDMKYIKRTDGSTRKAFIIELDKDLYLSMKKDSKRFKVTMKRYIEQIIKHGASRASVDEELEAWIG